VPPVVLLARLLVLLEVVVATTSAVESTVVAAVGFGGFGSAPATVVLAGTLGWQARRLGQGRVTRTLTGCQWAFLMVAMIDLALALLLTRGTLPLVGLLVRVAVPVTVLTLVRRLGPSC